MSFPPGDFLGFGFDMTAITPCDINAVKGSVLQGSRLIELSTGGQEHDYNGAIWTVPNGTNVATDIASGESSYNTYADGTKAAEVIETDASIAAKYMAVTVDASSSYAISKTFNENYQYAMFSFNQRQLIVGFQDFGSKINEAVLERRMNAIPTFDSKKPDVIEKYQFLYGTLGSHVITGATYGGRFQMTVWASNTDQSVNQNFSANVDAAFNGLTNGGSFNTSVKGSSEYETFKNSMQKTCSCLGGDVATAGSLGSDPTNPDVFKTYQQWAASARTNPGVMSFQVMSLWNLMSAANSDAVSNRASDVQKAFEWIVSHPRTHVTKARFTINSDWAEIGLLTPSAFITQDPDNPYPTDNTVFSTTKIVWGREHSHQFQRDVTIDFLITNDGSPIDITLSRGSDGSTARSGECMVEFNKKSYENKGGKDNNWNTEWFYRLNVNPYPVSTATTLARKKRPRIGRSPKPATKCVATEEPLSFLFKWRRFHTKLDHSHDTPANAIRLKIKKIHDKPVQDLRVNSNDLRGEIRYAKHMKQTKIWQDFRNGFVNS